MADTKDVAYIRKRLCDASDLMSEVFVRAEDMSKENIKLRKLLKECRGLFNRSTVDGEEPNNAELIMILTKIEKILGED